MRLRRLTDEDLPQSWALSRLTFGGDRDATPTPSVTPSVGYGAFDDRGRLVGRAGVRDYLQWWGGREVPMAGVIGVAVHPDSRGQGLLTRLMDLLVQECEQPVSTLFPTAAGIYRRLGWEVVGSLDETPVRLSALPRGGPVPPSAPPRGGGPVRPATADDLPAIGGLYAGRGAQGNGLLTRTGPCFPRGAAGVLDRDVVTVAEEDGQVTGYLSYDREGGYRGGGQLRVWDCVTSTPMAFQSLLAGLATWDSVADSLLWRGPTHDLALQLSGSLPPPSGVQAWMLRVLDPVAAVAARGFGPGPDPTGSATDPTDGPADRDGRAFVTGGFAVEGAGFRLEVADGRGVLTEVDAQGLPVLAVQGLALLFAGVGQGRLLRAGLLDRPVTGLEAAFAGPAPEILDYF